MKYNVAFLVDVTYKLASKRLKISEAKPCLSLLQFPTVICKVLTIEYLNRQRDTFHVTDHCD